MKDPSDETPPHEAYCPLPANPTRLQLRDARQMLMRLAPFNEDAKAELAVVNVLIRLRFPRRMRGEAVIGNPTKRGRRKKRRLIEAQDVMCRCGRCRGKGRLIIAEQSLTCPDCQGTGQVVGGTTDELVQFGSRLIRVRGLYRDSTPVRPAVPVGDRSHCRGYCGGRLIGPKRQGEATVRRYWPGEHSPILPSDVSAIMEAHAKQRLKDQIGTAPRNAKKFGSARDRRVLTSDQERRSKMADRTRQCQVLLNKENRRLSMSEGDLSLIHGPAARLLRKMGVDVKAIMAQFTDQPIPADGLDDPIIAEARRRGDLGPADMPSGRLSKLEGNHFPPLTARQVKVERKAVPA